MKSEIHGITCSCCESKSPEAKLILKEIHKILNESPTNVLSAKDETIKKIREVGALFNKTISKSDYEKFPASTSVNNIPVSLIPGYPSPLIIGSVGSISELVKLTEKVFSLPDGKIDYDILKLDPNKKVGGLKVTDISENPNLDISQIIDFSEINLNKFKKLKISVSPPTIVSTIEMKLGPISLGIDFRIGLNNISWNPTFKYDNPEDALKNLKGVTYKKILSESGKKSLADLQKLANNQFADKKVNSKTGAITYDYNTHILKSLAAAKNERDFFGLLNMQGVNIFETVDVEKEARALYENAVNVKKLEFKPLEKICPTITPAPAPYRKDEIDKVLKDACLSTTPKSDELGSDELGSDESDKSKAIINTEITIPSFSVPSAESEIKKIQSFASEVEGYSKKMQECGEKKVEINNKYWAFYEISLLNDISITYFENIRNTYEALNGSLVSILRKRDSIINEIALLNIQRQAIFDEYSTFYNDISILTQEQFKAFSLLGTAINVNLDEYASNPMGGTTSLNAIVGVTLSITPVLPQFLNSVQSLQQTKIIASLSTLDNKRGQLLASLSAVETEYNLFKNNINQNASIESIREKMSSHTNALSNLVGFKYTPVVAPTIFDLIGTPEKINTDEWTIQVAASMNLKKKEGEVADTSFFKKIKALWAESTTSPPSEFGGGIGGIATPLKNYMLELELPSTIKTGNKVTIKRDREGLYETGIWKPFYSTKRIDYFYSFKEQGYNQPKPEYDDEGNLIGTKVSKKFVNGQKVETTLEVPKKAIGLTCDSDIAINFLETLETTLGTKVAAKVEELKKGQPYKNYKNNILDPASRAEAHQTFYNKISSKSYLDGPRNIFAVSNLKDYQRKAYVLGLFKSKLAAEMSKIFKEIEKYDKCIEKNTKAIESAAKKLDNGSAGPNAQTLEAMCKKLLGSDPVGNKLPDGKCPTYLKNCYWTEYTKIMQMVSLMPIPELDPTNLVQRLFRYYPVAIQIPVPSPAPIVLPTLAMGIPDVMISIPLPLLWKHIITVNTPLGTIVTWIALAGPIPAPFIMLIDEKLDATYMITSRGPCSIPHPTVGGLNPLEGMSLLDMILPPFTVKINLSSPLGKLLVGNTNNDVNNPDDGKNVIDKLKEKIKTSLDQLEIPDLPSIGGNSELIKKRKKQIKEAFEKIPPDPVVIEEALNEVFKMVTDSIDKIKISNILIPKDDKGLMMSGLLGPLEVIDNLLKAIDTAASAPGEIAEQVLKDLGLGIKTINLTKKLKERILQELDSVEIKQFFIDLDVEIAELEASLSINANLSLEEKIEKRVDIIKKAVKKPLEKAIEKISPDLLGFIAKSLDLPPLPFPCYTNITFTPVPPYIYLIIAAFKAAPSVIDAIDAKTIAGLVSFELNLEKSLPNAEQLFYNSINGVLDCIPPLEFPDALSDNMFKQTIDMIKQIPLKFKVRLPKPGLPVQIAIPAALIKSIIKEAAQIAIDAIVGLIMAKVYEAIAEKNFQKIIAISLMIKALFGVELSEIKGSDIKTFINGMLDTSVYPALDAVSSIIDTVNQLKADFLSIIELFQFPPKLSLLWNEGPFYEVGTDTLKAMLEPLLNKVLPLLFSNMPMPIVLLACSSTPARLAFTKLHPTKPMEKVPAWEGLSTGNVPFLIWLDYLIATAQRKSGLGSTYLIPYQGLP